MIMVASTALPGLGATVEQFTDGTGERGMFLRAGQPDNSSRVPFPSDTRVRDASVTLKANHSLEYAQLPVDGGNVSGWWSTVETIDLTDMNVDDYMGTAFTPDEMTRISLNSTTSSKSTLSANATAHMFSFNLTALVEGGDRDMNLVIGWTGMGTQQGPVSTNSVDLYIADFAMDRWYQWEEFDRMPAAPDQEHLHLSVGPYSGLTDDEGMIYILAAVDTTSDSTGSNLVTSYVLFEAWRSRAPADLEVDVGGDGTPEFAWDGAGTGMYGLQNELEDGTDIASADFGAQSDHVNLTSFLVPVGAELVDASLALAGQPGDVTVGTTESPEIIDPHSFTLDTEVPNIPDYAHPSWAQVVLTELKNAGMKDQSQEISTTGQIIGDYGAGARSIAQSFTPSITGRLTAVNVSLEGAVYSPAPNVEVEIRTTNATGFPTTTVLGSAVIDGSRLNTTATDWLVVSFSDIELTAGVEYAMVLTIKTAAASQTYEWKNHFQVSGDPYNPGSSFVSDTIAGSGPWAAVANTDQAFQTYMETDIGAGVSLVKVAGRTFSHVQPGPMGDEYVFNISKVTANETGVWLFPITNANPFPVTFNWSAVVHNDVYPQDFGMRISTEAAGVDLFALLDSNISLEGYQWIDIKAALETAMDGAPVEYTAPNGFEFIRVNVTMRGDVTGVGWMSGLRVRYHLPVVLDGPGVTAAVEAFRDAMSHLPTVELPVEVTSSVPARVLLADPLVDYDQRPTFTTQTQIIPEDGTTEVDMDTLFGDDYDNNNLTYELISNTQSDSLSAVLNGTVLNLTPEANWNGEADVTVRGTDSSNVSTDGVIKVVVQPKNDPPVVDILDPVIDARARETKIVDLESSVSDIDGDEVTLTTNSSHITVDGLILYCLFDAEGDYHVLLTASDPWESTNETLTFEVTPARGFPSIVGLPSEFLVPVNRPLPINLQQFGQDDDDDPADLVWTVSEDTDLYDAVLAADGFNLTITPTGPDLGAAPLTLTLTNTKDNSVTESVRVNITERVKEPPRINHETLPSKIKLKEDGDSYVLILEDHVEDEFTPISQLRVDAIFTKEGVIYVDVQAGNMTFVPQTVGKTKVTVTLTNLDDLSSSFEVNVEVSEKSDGDGINWTFWIILLFIGVVILVLIAWPRQKAAAPSTGATVVPQVPSEDLEVPAKRVDKVKPHTFGTSSMRSLEDVILFHSSGLLISQYSRKLREGVDKDLEGAVITAIQEQLRGKMRTREEPVDLIELEGMQVVIERGADVALAAVLSTTAPEGLRMNLRRSLNEVQTRNAAALKGWDGDHSSLRGIDNALVALIEALIKEHNGSQDLAVDGEAVGATHGGRGPPAVVEGVPPLEDEDEPLHLVKDIIGEEKTKEIKEGRHHDESSEWEES
jgi:hypothetical protein